MDFSITLSWPGGSRSFDANSELSVLELAVAAGVPVPNSCQRGDCGQCKAELVLSDGIPPTAEKIVYLCMTHSLTPSEYRLKGDPFRAPELVRAYRAKVRSIDRITENVVRLVIVTPPNKFMEFCGGQFARLTVVDGITRDYSIASVDPISREITFYIRLLNSGKFSNWLTERATVGQLLQMRGPMGCFALLEQAVGRSWFVATGTGIVPIYALLCRMDDDHSRLCGQKTLLWGNRTEGDLFLLDELKTVCAAKDIAFQVIFSQDERHPKARVTDILVKQDLADSAVYAAGFSQMVCDVHKLVLDRGLCESRFHADIF